MCLVAEAVHETAWTFPKLPCEDDGKTGFLLRVGVLSGSSCGFFNVPVLDRMSQPGAVLERDAKR